MQSSRRCFQLGAALALVFFSCGRAEIEEYHAPKTDFSSKPVNIGQNGHSHPVAAEEPKWDLPEGWTAHPGSGLRFATLHIDDGTPPLELRVTPLALSAGDPLSNVNRWASQIGLPPYQPSQLGSVLRDVNIQGRAAKVAKLVGPPSEADPAQQILAAIIPGERSAWFFMIMGEEERVSPFEGRFDSFLQTVSISNGEVPASAESGGGSEPASAGQSVAPGSSGETMTWQLPENWVEQPGASAMRVATIVAELGGESAEITVTKFPGNVGGLLPNINRWRGQLGLPAVSSVAAQPLEELRVAATPAKFLDLVADPNSVGGKRMYVVSVARREMTWFLKMTGPAGFLETQRPAYDAFVASVGFTGGSSGD